jgi:steroid 5-alpha reductase family enzyme
MRARFLFSIVSGLFHWSTVDLTRPFGSPRTMVMGLLTTSWGLRLTWNYARKGGYEAGVEDYRWAEVRKWMPGYQFHVFNCVFICLYQPLLLMAIAAPAAVAAGHPDVALGPCDVAAAALFSLLLLGETVADLQMFDFQTEKWVQHPLPARATTSPLAAESVARLLSLSDSPADTRLALRG